MLLFRRLHQLNSKSPVASSLKSQFHELQANKTANQSEISKLSSFYKNSSSEQLSSKCHLNNALYFSSIFSQKISDNLLRAAQEHVKLLDDDVLKVLSQKLLRLNQWPTAEKLIIMKFDAAEAEIVKFEVFALNGNYRKMLDQLPQLVKSSSIPQKAQFQLISILNSKDGRLPAFDDVTDVKPWFKLLQIAVKGRLLSLNPPTFRAFLRMSASLSQIAQVDPSLLILGFTKSCEAGLDAESIPLLKSIFSTMMPDNLMILAEKLLNSNKEFPEELISALLEQLCKHRIGTNERTTSSLLSWIIKFCPDQYSYHLLLRDYNELIDEKLARQALNSIGLNDKDVMNFIEFCMTKRNISIERKALKRAMDIAAESFNYEPSEEFLRFIHQKGYVLSSIFYLNQLHKLIEGSPNLTRAFECFKLITSGELHGELLQNYIQKSQKLLDLSVSSSNLDYCYKIYTASAKYQILNTLSRPKSFSDFVFECYSAGKFKIPFRPTINMDCIRSIIDCSQKINDSNALINEKFCAVALQAALTNLDFLLAQQLRVYMNNRGYIDGGITFGQNILQQWAKKLVKEKNNLPNITLIN